MILVEPSAISKIDNFASDTLGISKRTLMLRAAEAVAKAVKSMIPLGSAVRILAGKGNNGGDGYVAALLLMRDYDVKVYDVFGSGQRSEEGIFYLNSYRESGGRIESSLFDEKMMKDLKDSDCIIDAVFGTGFVGELPPVAAKIAKFLSSLEEKNIIAIDVPLGVNALDGSVDTDASYHATATVTLGFVKTGLVSYPAKEYVGKLIYDNIGLHIPSVLSEFKFNNHYIDYEIAKEFIPERKENSSKGNFGKLLMITGSSSYPGAAHLTLEASLRAGVGYVNFLGEGSLCDSLLSRLPEAIYTPFSLDSLTDSGARQIAEISSRHNATLIGSGSSRSDKLRRLVAELLCEDGAPLILDADAINVLSEDPEEGRALIRNSRRAVILTPHPLELSRISGIPTDDIQRNRISIAKAFALENRCVLILKGAGTVVTDGDVLFINSSGSSALAKAGSGDVLAGTVSSLVAMGLDPIKAAALAVFLHGLAADELSLEYSKFGVIPSDLPREIARQLAKLISA